MERLYAKNNTQWNDITIITGKIRNINYKFYIDKITKNIIRDNNEECMKRVKKWDVDDDLKIS